MSGGPREWTMTTAESSGARRIIKGGENGGSREKGFRCAFATDDAEGYADLTLSFRCCRNADEK